MRMSATGRMWSALGSQGPQAYAFAQLCPFELRRIGERGARRLDDEHFLRDGLEVRAKVHRALETEHAFHARLDAEVAKHFLIGSLGLARGEHDAHAGRGA